ncbi:MAG: DUF5615 family PIN-like protein [Rhodospirillales bacterium]|nr:DUF5615 family PIN-like protein [Rhodospirillales bacterium]
MRLLFDENLSFRLIGALDSEFPGSVHVRSAGLARAGDMAIWQYARQHGLAIVTLDSGFHDISVLHGAPPKIVWLRSLDTCPPAQCATCCPDARRRFVPSATIRRLRAWYCTRAPSWPNKRPCLCVATCWNAPGNRETSA